MTQLLFDVRHNPHLDLFVHFKGPCDLVAACLIAAHSLLLNKLGDVAHFRELVVQLDSWFVTQFGHVLRVGFPDVDVGNERFLFQFLDFGRLWQMDCDNQ